MGKLASTIRNTFLGGILLVLVYLSYRLYEIAARLLVACDKITETNTLITDLYNVMIQLAKKVGVRI